VEIISQDYQNIVCTGSSKSAGRKLDIGDKQFIVEDTHTFEFMRDQISIFNTEADVSAQYIPKALAAGGYVIDSSSHYRMDKNVPLIVPNIGSIDIAKARLFAHANCIVSPIASVLYPLHKRFNVERVIISTYQSTAGAGKAAMDECFVQTKKFCDNGKREESLRFPRPIAFNIIPQIGDFNVDGVSGEEDKICKELQKIIDCNLYISATSVRVPVLVGHSVSLSLRFTGSKDEVMEILRSSPRVVVTDSYRTPIEVMGQDKVFLSRIRSDMMNNEQWFHMWLCSDSLRVGAASDACDITKEIIKQVEASYT
jgi:aspartate-semialdehyde dehydrogenase